MAFDGTVVRQMSQKRKIRSSHKRQAFTLIELLVVISIIALLMAILMPALSSAKEQGRAVVCRSNIRQLVLANIGYAIENNDYYVPAAPDMYPGGKNNQRWHGVREDNNSPFDSLKGPLVDYLGDGKVKKCPEKVRFVKGRAWNVNFEQGGDGYGYNMTYIGSRLWQKRSNENYGKTAKTTEVTRTAETLMFADCAMARKEIGSPPYLQEYSFAEPPFYLSNGQPVTTFYMSPSIHFRHRDRANIGWVDGHISSAERIDYDDLNVYQAKSSDFDIGWFGRLDNSLYDLK